MVNIYENIHKFDFRVKRKRRATPTEIKGSAKEKSKKQPL